jgi:hypothetical protein
MTIALSYHYAFSIHVPGIFDYHSHESDFHPTLEFSSLEIDLMSPVSVKGWDGRSREAPYPDFCSSSLSRELVQERLKRKKDTKYPVSCV